MRRIRLLLPFLCAAFPLAAQDAPSPAAGADSPARLSQETFDPKDYLEQTRWSDGCYGVSLAEPKGMDREPFPELHSPAKWTSRNRADDWDITASFLLPSGHSEDKAAPELSLKNTAAFLLSNLTAGQGAAYPLPQFSRDLVADRHAVTVAYYLLRPMARKHAAPEDSFLVGAAIMRVNPRCHFVLRLICRIPAGTQGDLPFLVDAQRRLEAMAGSIRLVPEATMTALREAQLARGADVLARLPAAPPLPPGYLLRIVRDERDIGWMRLEMRRQDKAWYAAHPPAANSVDGLRMPGLKVTVRSHTQDEGALADVRQDFFKASDSPYESWQRTSTFRSTAQGQGQTASEMGSVLPAQGKRPTMLQVEWAGTTPPGLAHFFRANPKWREKQSARAANAPGARTAPDAPLLPGAVAAAADPGKNLGGSLQKDYWEMSRLSLSQAHAWILPWLLPPGTAQSYAFAFYSPEARHPGFCLFRVSPAQDGSRRVFFRPALDQPEQVFAFDVDGTLRRIQLPDGTLLIPTTVEKLAEVWKLAPKEN